MFGISEEKDLSRVEQRDRMLRAVNETAALLLTADENGNIESSLKAGMEILGSSMGADRVHIWRDEIIDGEPQFSHTLTWVSENGKQKATVPEGAMTPYRKMSEWREKFSRNEHISGPVSALSLDELEYFDSFDIKSVAVVPLFLNEQFWGIFSIDDCTRERDFSADEINILRSVSLMMASVINRHELAAWIKAANERTRMLLDKTPLCCQLWDSSLRKIDCNEAAVKLFGLKSKKEFLRRSHELYPEYQPDGVRSVEKSKKYVEIAFKEGQIEFEWTYKMLDGTLMPAEIYLVRDKYKDDEIVLGYTRDMREHKRMMEDIEYRDNMLEAVNKAAVKLLTMEENEGIEAPIMEGMELVGRAVEADRVHIWRNEMIGDKLYYLCAYSWFSETSKRGNEIYQGLRIAYDDRPGWESKFNDGGYISGPITKMPPSNQEFFADFDIKSVVIIPLYLNEQFWGLFSVDDACQERDFSEDEITILRSVSLMMASEINRHLMLMEIRETHDHTMLRLETLVEERTQELQLQTEKLMENERRLAANYEHVKKLSEAADMANRAKSSFLANMSHEIRTPMNAILGTTDILMQDESISVEVEEGLCMISNSCNMLMGIINDILDFSKIEAGKMDITPAPYKVSNLINDSVQLNLMRFNGNHIEFELQIDEKIPATLIGDELRIKQIINNLLSNAFKYTEEGKVTLSVVAEPWPGNEGITLVIIVRDTGRGMNEEQMSRLFDEYARFNKEAGSSVEGTGLGLAITQRLVGQMDGGINVDSEPGVGSTFVVRLPQATAGGELLGRDVAESLKQFQVNYVTRGRRGQFVREYMPYGKALIVDDVETNLFVAEGLMKPYGLKIETTASGRGAIERIENGKVYDIVFMDHMMPGMDGIEVAMHLRGMGYTHPIVALSANAVAGQADIFLKNGFDEFISKPIDIRQLDSILNKYIRDKQSQETIEAARHSKQVSEGSLVLLEGHIMDADAFESARMKMREGQPEDSECKAGISSYEIAGLDVGKGLERYDGDEETYLRILQSYAIGTREMLGAVGAVSEGDDLLEYKIKVHGIKGASFDVFAGQVSAMAKELECAAASGDFAFINKHNKPFLEATWELINSIEGALDALSAENPKPLKAKPDIGVLERLRAACEDYDMDGADAAMAEVERYQYDSDSGLAVWLREKLNMMNFSEIVQRLSNLDKVG